MKFILPTISLTLSAIAIFDDISKSNKSGVLGWTTASLWIICYLIELNRKEKK